MLSAGISGRQRGSPPSRPQGRVAQNKKKKHPESKEQKKGR